MPTHVSRAEQRAALDAAGARLRDHDIDGYWAALEQQDPYAGLARDAAGNRGELGQTANARLERFARAARGRDLSDAERDAIRHDVATADLAQRESNLAESGDHRISGQQSVDYHSAVFATHGISKEAYFPAVVQPGIGSNWGYLAGIVLRDAPSAIDPTAIPWKDIPDWGRQDWKPVSDRLLHEDIAVQAKTLPTQGLMEIEGFHADPQQAAPAPQIAPRTQQGGDASTSFAARLAAIPPAPDRQLDFLLGKPTAGLPLADLHALQAHDAYLKPQHPRHDEAFTLVSDTYRHLYGDAPQGTDATGRPGRGEALRTLPAASQPGPAERQRQAALQDFGRQLDSWQYTLDPAPDSGATAPDTQLTAALQHGLNDLLWPGRATPTAAQAARRPYRDGPVLVDGRLGPVTGQALDRAEAEGLLPDLLQRIHGRFVVPPATPAPPRVTGSGAGSPPEEFFYSP